MSYLPYIGVGVTALIWVLILIPRWARSAERRGGKWYLEGLLMICGPATSAIMAMYPKGAVGATLTGPFPLINRYLSYAAMGLVIIALVQGLRQPRRHAGAIVAVVAFFYLALIFSCMAGRVPAFPEPYWVTPLLVLAILIHGGYTHEWLLQASRTSLRVILVLSFAALLDPAIGFNYDESRTFFGLARMQGITPHPNTFAFIAVIGLVLEMHMASKMIWKLLFVAGILMAQSTTAYLMAAVWVLLLVTRFSQSARVAAGVAALVAVLAAIVDKSFADRVLEELLPSTAGSFNGRTAIWNAVLYGFESNPIFGYGPSLLDDDYRQAYLPNFDAAAQAHNQWFQTLGGTGIVGVASLVILAVVLLVFACRARRVTSGLTIAMIAILALRGVTETPLRPAGASVATFCLIIILAIVASSPDAKTGPGQTAEDVNEADLPPAPTLARTRLGLSARAPQGMLNHLPSRQRERLLQRSR